MKISILFQLFLNTVVQWVVAQCCYFQVPSRPQKQGQCLLFWRKLHTSLIVKVTQTSQLDREAAEYINSSSTVVCIQGCHRLVNGFLPYLSLEPWTKNVQPYIKKKMSIVFEKRRKTSCDSSVQLCMKKSEIGFILPCHSVLPTKSFHSKPFWQMSLAKLRAFFFQRLHKFTMFTVQNGTNVRIEETLRNTLAKI